MRKTRTIDALFPKTRQAVLTATLLQPARAWFLSDLAKHLGLTPSTLQRELASLAAAGLLRHWRDGKRAYYQADDVNPLLPDLQRLLEKSAGLADIVADALTPLAEHIRVAFIHGSIARAAEGADSDVDLILIGEPSILKELALVRKNLASRLGREINSTLYTPGEFAKKVRDGQHFARSLLGKEKLFVIGGQDELDQVTGGEADRPGADQPGGDRRAARGRRTQPQ